MGLQGRNWLVQGSRLAEELLGEQTKQWTDMMMKQRKEEWELMKGHAGAQEEIFKKLFETVTAKQMKELETFFAK